MFTALAFLAVTLGATPRADGNELLAKCAAVIHVLDGDRKAAAQDDATDFGYCIGLAHGITETIRVYESKAGNSGLTCLPEGGLQAGQTARVIMKFLKEHPERLHEPDALLAIVALNEAFPCQQATKSAN